MEASEENAQWIQKEMACVDFGDVRLNKRFHFLASELAGKPAQPINQASTDWAATKAAYRFFNNPKVTAEQILEPHFQNTRLRAEGHRRLVVVQDTSIIDFSSHVKIVNLGPTGKKSDGYEPQGLLLHCALALTERGLPLGLFTHKVWPRMHVKEKNSHLRSLLPVEEKESFKWFEGLRTTLRNSPGHDVIMVCDRESDIYEFLQETLACGMDFVVRANHPRMLDDEEFGDINIFDRLAIAPVNGVIEIEVPGCGKRPPRKAKLAVKFLPVVYAARPRGIKTKQTSKRSNLNLNIVHLFEEGPPENETPIQWTLVTTLEAGNLKEALEVVKFYKMRWEIELYFKTLKTGCGIEKCRLGSAEKLIRYITLQSIIAWRLLWILS